MPASVLCRRLSAGSRARLRAVGLGACAIAPATPVAPPAIDLRVLHRDLAIHMHSVITRVFTMESDRVQALLGQVYRTGNPCGRTIVKRVGTTVRRVLRRRVVCNLQMCQTCARAVAGCRYAVHRGVVARYMEHWRNCILHIDRAYFRNGAILGAVLARIGDRVRTRCRRCDS